MGRPLVVSKAVLSICPPVGPLVGSEAQPDRAQNDKKQIKFLRGIDGYLAFFRFGRTP